MSPKGEGFDVTPRFVSGRSAATIKLDRDLGHENHLAGLARTAETRRGRINEVYWPQAEAKGITRGKTYQVGGKQLEVKALVLRGQHCFVVLNDDSGFNRKEIKLDDPFWNN